MERHDPSGMTGSTDEAGCTEAHEADAEAATSSRDMEIWKVLTGADIELDVDFLDSTYVEADEGFPNE
jgi:hypothetical protein